MTIGDRIALRRKQLGLTQFELAQKMGYKSKSSINKIELGITDVAQKNIIKLAEALETDPAWLMGWEEKEQPALSEKRQAALELIEKLSDDQIDAILRLLGE